MNKKETIILNKFAAKLTRLKNNIL